MATELGSTYGLMYIGVLLSAVLFGATNLQVFIYSQKYRQDSIWNKRAVYILWILDALHLALCGHMIYFYLITSFLDPLALSVTIWSFKAQIVVDAIVVTLVHTLYTIRLWKMTLSDSESAQRVLKRGPLYFVSLIVLVGYGGAAVLCYRILTINTYAGLFHNEWLVYFALGAATVIDIILAGSLCYTLVRCRTGFDDMDSTIRKLMMYTLNTGVLTAVCSTSAMILFAALPGTFAVLAAQFLVTRLYINSFIAMLNARNRLRSEANISSLSESQLRTRHLSAGSSATVWASAAKRFSYGQWRTEPVAADLFAAQFPPGTENLELDYLTSSIGRGESPLSRKKRPSTAPGAVGRRPAESLRVAIEELPRYVYVNQYTPVRLHARRASPVKEEDVHALLAEEPEVFRPASPTLGYWSSEIQTVSETVGVGVALSAN